MVRKNVTAILTNHVTFELEATDRMYLNAYVPSLQTGGGLVYFLQTQFGVRVPSTVMVAPMSAMPNHYDVYILDRDFGPLFIKFSSYFPYARSSVSMATSG